MTRIHARNAMSVFLAVLFIFYCGSFRPQETAGKAPDQKQPQPKATVTMWSCDSLITEDLFLYSDISPKEVFTACYEFSKEKLAEFHAMINKTIDHSRRTGTYALIIDKAAYRLNLVKDGKAVARYNIELGFDPCTQKTRQGDYCTPEGSYRVEAKKEGEGTKYYKALLINYPNAEDWKRFRRLKRSGALSDPDNIGGLIEIHGKGTGLPGNDGGVNWTLGCVALSNDDMSAIYDKVGVGTPVLIVKYGANSIGYLNDMPEMKYLIK